MPFRRGLCVMAFPRRSGSDYRFRNSAFFRTVRVSPPTLLKTYTDLRGPNGRTRIPNGSDVGTKDSQPSQKRPGSLSENQEGAPGGGDVSSIVDEEQRRDCP